jgi:hypothetical protein
VLALPVSSHILGFREELTPLVLPRDIHRTFGGNGKLRSGFACWSNPMADPTKEQITLRAYEIWEKTTSPRAGTKNSTNKLSKSCGMRISPLPCARPTTSSFLRTQCDSCRDFSGALTSTAQLCNIFAFGLKVRQVARNGLQLNCGLS